jgi:hypothetical protein
MNSSLRNKLSILVQRRLQIERRSSRRVAPAHRTLCLILASGENEQTTAIVENLSNKGIAVLAERAYTPGAILNVLLVNASHTFSLAVEMKVTRSTRIGSDQYLIAGPFARPLSHEEVVPFIL